MDKIALLERRVEREKKARKQAEKILEEKAIELFHVNQELKNISEKKINQIQSKFENSQKRYQNVLSNLNLGLLEQDQEGYITKVNKVFCEMVDYTSEELVGNISSNILLPDDLTASDNKKLIDRNLEESKIYDIKVMRKDGTLIDLIVCGAPFYDDYGNMVGTLDVHYDVTKEKKLQQELKEAKEIAERAQQAEKQFLTNMSHEIKTPLNVIVGMSHLLNDTKLDAQQHEYLDILKSSADILFNLISEVLDFAKIDAGKISVVNEEFDIVQELNNIHKIFKIKLENKPVSLQTKIDEKIQHCVVGDKKLFNQVIVNLLGNASKFTEEGSIICTATIVHESETHIEINFKVKDSGIGIAEDKLETIFQNFEQANESISKNYGGTGLGLAICQSIVEAQNSTIKVQSAEGLGSTFQFNLVFEKSERKITEQDVFVEDSSVNLVAGSTILYVEDNPLNSLYLSRLLDKWNLRYEHAENGLIATEKIAHTKYDLILMDIQMPVMNGYQATKVIRTTENPNQKTPIAALTASTLGNNLDKAKDFGFSDFLAKPFQPPELKKLLLKYLKHDIADDSPETATVQNPKVKIQLDENQLKQVFGDDEEYKKEIITMFLETIDEQMSVLDNLIKTGIHDDIRKQAHKLKPNFSMVGFPELTDDFVILEKLAKSNDTIENIITHYSLITDKVDQLKPQLKSHI